MSYLKDRYRNDQLPRYNKWPHVRGKKFINLCLLSKYEVTPRQAHQYTNAMFYGKISSISQNMTMEDIAKTHDGSILKGRRRCILIEGAPGVGKSTLAWKLCHKWGKGKILQQYRVVLLLRLREKRVRQVKTEKDMFKLHKPIATKELCESHGERVLLVLDGWDELPVELRGKDSFFLDLLQGQVLPDAAVLVTSRPHASEIIVTECGDCVFQHIQIAGFTEDNVQAFVGSNIGEDPELLQDFNTYLDSYPHIKSMMYNPLNAAIVVQVYKDCHNQKVIIPKTMTELYSSLTRSLLLRYLKEHLKYGFGFDQFSDLPPDVHKKLCIVSKLAYEGITNQQQVIFDNLPDDFDSLGLMQCVPDLYVDVGAVMSYNFLHLTIQEYFAAYHMSQQSTEEQVKMLKLYQNDTSMKMVLKFFAGLTNFDGISDDFLISLLTISDLVNNVLVLSVDGIHFLFEARHRINVFNTQSQVYNKFYSLDSSPFDYYVIGYVISYTSCKWVADFQDSTSTTCLLMFAKGAKGASDGSFEYPIKLKVGNSLDYLSTPPPSIDLQSLVSASEQFLERVKELRLDVVTLHENSHKLFSSQHLRLHSLELIKIKWPNSEMLCQLIRLLYKQNTLRNFTVSQRIEVYESFPFHKKVEYEALCKWLSCPQCSLRTLNIGGNDLSLEATKSIIYILSENCTLESLDISQSLIYSEALSTLLQLPLVALNIGNCKLDSRAIDVIAKALYSNLKLEALGLSHNPIGSEGVIKLAQMLKKNNILKKLDLSYCGDTSQAAVISHTAVQILEESAQHKVEVNLKHLNDSPTYCQYY